MGRRSPERRAPRTDEGKCFMKGGQRQTSPPPQVASTCLLPLTQTPSNISFETVQVGELEPHQLLETKPFKRQKADVFIMCTCVCVYERQRKSSGCQSLVVSLSASVTLRSSFFLLVSSPELGYLQGVPASNFLP